MSLVAAEFYKRCAERVDGRALERVREILKDLLVPDRITRDFVEKMFRKALRLGFWRRLRPETRALILALRVFPRPVRSPVLVSILREVFLDIELQTLRGRALFYGVLIALREAGSRLLKALADVSRLLFLGVSYLNSPPMYRVLG